MLRIAWTSVETSSTSLIADGVGTGVLLRVIMIDGSRDQPIAMAIFNQLLLLVSYSSSGSKRKC